MRARPIPPPAGGATVDWPTTFGALRFLTILQRAEAQGLQHAFVEQDWPEDAIEDLRASHRHRRALGY